MEISFAHSEATKHYFVEGLAKTNTDDQNLSTLLSEFKTKISQCVGLLSNVCVLTPLNSADLLTYLNACITGEWLPIAVPPDKSFIDVILSQKTRCWWVCPKN